MSSFLAQHSNTNFVLHFCVISGAFLACGVLPQKRINIYKSYKTLINSHQVSNGSDGCLGEWLLSPCSSSFPYSFPGLPQNIPKYSEYVLEISLNPSRAMKK